MLGLYAALLGPELPQTIRNLFENTIFKMVILFLVVVRGNKNPQMALMIAVAYVLTLEYLQKQDVISGFASISQLGHNEDHDDHELEYQAQFSEDFDGTLELDTFETVENLNEIEAMANVEFADDDEHERFEGFSNLDDTDNEYELFSEDEEHTGFSSEEDEHERFANDDDEHERFANDDDEHERFANDDEEHERFANDDEEHERFANDDEEHERFANDDDEHSLPYNYEGFANDEDDENRAYYSM
jgi:hypothetical protein